MQQCRALRGHRLQASLADPRSRCQRGDGSLGRLLPKLRGPKGPGEHTVEVPVGRKAQTPARAGFGAPLAAAHGMQHAPVLSRRGRRLFDDFKGRPCGGAQLCGTGTPVALPLSVKERLTAVPVARKASDGWHVLVLDNDLFGGHATYCWLEERNQIPGSLWHHAWNRQLAGPGGRRLQTG